MRLERRLEDTSIVLCVSVTPTLCRTARHQLRIHQHWRRNGNSLSTTWGICGGGCSVIHAWKPEEIELQQELNVEDMARTILKVYTRCLEGVNVRMLVVGIGLPFAADHFVAETARFIHGGGRLLRLFSFPDRFSSLFKDIVHWIPSTLTLFTF